MKNSLQQRFLLALVILVAVFIYNRSMDYGLVNWDDKLLRMEEFSKEPSARILERILSPSFSGTYQPVRDLTMMLLARWAGPERWWPYHLVSLFFYLATVLLAFLVFRLLLERAFPDRGREGAAWGALIGAGAFALHPSHVEVTAWVLGQKDSLVGFFYVAAFYVYARSEKLSTRELVLSFILFLLALGSKPSAVSLALVLPLYDFVFRPPVFKKREGNRQMAAYFLFLLPALAAIFYFAFTTARIGSVIGAPFRQMAKAAGALVFSASKLLLPVNLCLRYPALPGADLSDPAFYFYTAAALLLVLWTVKALRARKPYAFFLAWAVLALLPNANLIPIRIERADRYYYLSSIGFCALMGYAGLALHTRCRKNLRPLLAILAGLMFTSLAAVSYHQIGFWRDGPSAWRRVCSIYPDLTLARVALGHSYLNADELDLALSTYQPLLDRTVPNTEALKGAAQVYFERGDRKKALELLQRGLKLNKDDLEIAELLASYHLEMDELAQAETMTLYLLQLKPSSPTGWFMLAEVHRRQGKLDQAVQALEKVIEIRPYDYRSYNNLAMIRWEQGQVAEAEKLFLCALELEPGFDQARLSLASLYANTGQNDRALQIFERYELDKLSLVELEYLGRKYAEQNQLDKALKCFLETTERWPKLARGYNNAGVIYERMKQSVAAESYYREAVRLDSAYVDAYYNWGNLLFGLGKLSQALHYYSVADTLSAGADSMVIEALGRAWLAQGDSARARKFFARLGQGLP